MIKNIIDQCLYLIKNDENLECMNVYKTMVADLASKYNIMLEDYNLYHR